VEAYCYHSVKHREINYHPLIPKAGDALQMIVSGELKQQIHHRYPLAEAQQPHRDLEGNTTGKLLLIP
jgi:NADPH2:quinone reductase